MTADSRTKMKQSISILVNPYSLVSTFIGFLGVAEVGVTEASHDARSGCLRNVLHLTAGLHLQRVVNRPEQDQRREAFTDGRDLVGRLLPRVPQTDLSGLAVVALVRLGLVEVRAAGVARGPGEEGAALVTQN